MLGKALIKPKINTSGNICISVLFSVPFDPHLKKVLFGFFSHFPCREAFKFTLKKGYQQTNIITVTLMLVTTMPAINI